MAQGAVSTSTVSWPKSIKGTPVQQTLERFFRAADDPTKEGSIAFSKCFTSSGELIARGHVCRGQDGK